MTKAFFLDRDGTINVDTDYVHRIDEWQWCRGAIESIRWMNDEGYKVIVVTNQSGISRGRYTLEQVNELHQWVSKELQNKGAWVDGWYVAPYHPNFTVGGPWPAEDRKPDIGMFQKAIDKYNIDPKQSYMIGDKISDIEPALNLGISPFLVKTRHFVNQSMDWLEEQKIPIYNDIADVMTSIRKRLNSPS